MDEHGVILNHDGHPWVITAIDAAPDGTPYAMFAEAPGGHRLAQCERANAAPQSQTPSQVLDDAALLAKAHAARNSAKFTQLWHGNTSGYGGDDSAADMALCCMLAFWTQDAAQLDRLFRQSGLMRPKWDSKRGDETYGSNTITAALRRQQAYYTGANGAQFLVQSAIQQAQQAQNSPTGVALPSSAGSSNSSGTPGPQAASAADAAAKLLADLKAAPADDRLTIIYDAIDTILAALSTTEWAVWVDRAKMLLGKQLNRNTLEKARNEAQARQQRAAARATIPAWQQALFTKKTGELEETDNNLQAIFAKHGNWQGRLWWDTVAQRAYLDDQQPLDIHYVRNDVVPWLGTTMRMPVRHSPRVLEVMRSWAQRQPRDPIQEWLATLAAYDDTDLDRTLLETWLVQHAGAEDTPYTRFASRMLVVSMVKRAMQPGCQYRYVIVLEGEEDLGKTQLLRILGDRWHQEFPKTVEGKEAYMQLQGFWLVELGELDALKPAQETRIKMFISQQMDVWVPKYENDVVERPRRAILVGTTNEREYLKGEHGNTRYFPLWLEGPIQREAIAGIRERLFVQAKAFLADHPDDWWCIPDDVEEELAQARKARQEPSIFDDKLAPFCAARTRSTVAEAFEYLLVPVAQWSKRLEMEVGKAFKANGWYRHIERDTSTKKVSRFWANTPQQKPVLPF